MKTMKYLLSLCLVICASLISLTSCSNDYDETGFKFNYSDRAKNDSSQQRKTEA